MTETRKKIIEIIEPFMDKTLNEWCIILNANSWQYLTYWGNDWTFERMYCFAWGWTWLLVISIDRIWIIWHYDITAVLKYVVQSGRSYDFDFHYIKIWQNDSWILTPNKPLHLYTEQEDKNLLELLQKIKWN